MIQRIVLLFVVAFVSLLMATVSVDAAASINPIVDCTAIKVNGTTFSACATGSFTSPSPAITEGGETMYLGGYSYEYTIVTGLKEGTDTTTMWAVDLNKATSNGIVVSVNLDDDKKCKVTVAVKGKATACKSCRPCNVNNPDGVDKFTADCTNVKNGRSVSCESVATGNIYFPLTKAALSTPTPFAVIKAPAKAPVKAPRAVSTPKAAPVRAPRKAAPVKRPTTTTAKAPVKRRSQQ